VEAIVCRQGRDYSLKIPGIVLSRVVLLCHSLVSLPFVVMVGRSLAILTLAFPHTFRAMINLSSGPPRNLCQTQCSGAGG